MESCLILADFDFEFFPGPLLCLVVAILYREGAHIATRFCERGVRRESVGAILLRVLDYHAD